MIAPINYEHPVNEIANVIAKGLQIVDIHGEICVNWDGDCLSMGFRPENWDKYPVTCCLKKNRDGYIKYDVFLAFVKIWHEATMECGEES